MNKSDERMGTERIGKLMFSMGIPTLIAMLINLLYNIVDRMFIGHMVGAQALTGVGLTLSVIMFISAVSSLAGAGGAPLAGIALGKGEREQAHKILGNAMFMLCVFSVILVVVFYVIQQPFLYMIGASDVTYPYASSYLKIYLIGTIFVECVIGLNPFVTAQGQAKIAMVSVLIGAIMNIILDPIFIYVLGMGVRGAAVATVISQLSSAIWVLKFLTSDKAALRLRLSYMKPELLVIRQIVSLGISPFIMQSTESLIAVVLSSRLQKYGGDIYVGSLTILQSVLQVINVSINGFTMGVQPILSYNFGAGNIDRVKATYRTIFKITVSASFIMTLFVILFPGIFARLFTSDPELIEVVIRVLPVYICGMLIFGVQMGSQTTFVALGQAKISLFIALLRKVILLVPFAIIFPMITGNVISIYFAECIADSIAATTCGVLFCRRIDSILQRGA